MTIAALIYALVVAIVLFFLASKIPEGTLRTIAHIILVGAGAIWLLSHFAGFSHIFNR